MKCYIILGYVLDNDMQTPLSPQKWPNFIFVAKDAKYSETYAKTIFRFFLNFFVQRNYHFQFLGLGDFYEHGSETLTSDTR